MVDIKTREKRSRNMSAIKSKETKPEVYLRKLLFRNGYRYRKYSAKIPGHPDVWLKRYNTAIYINGCFWHRHKGCKYAYTPKSRCEFWLEKFEKNTRRDKEVYEELKKNNYKCLVIWECTIKDMIKNTNKETSILNEIKEFLISKELFKEL